MLELRSQGLGRAVHARLPGALAELQAGLEIFLQFAFHVGAIGVTEKDELEKRSGRALNKLSVLQANYQSDADPALRWKVALVRNPRLFRWVLRANESIPFRPRSLSNPLLRLRRRSS